MTLNISEIISGIALIISVTSTISGPLINSRYQLKIKKIELFQPKRIEVIDKYIKNAALRINKYYHDEFKLYKDRVLMYIPDKNLQSQIVKLNQLILNDKYEEAKPLLEELSTELSKLIDIK
ncbi:MULTISPECIES: hypothetical protein [Anaerofustis]|uniref:hypothetical protein n=1 Tax=Anaerofustis TaxID=264995 RepID=UPI001106FC44|nr:MULTISPECIES: hypothetical protein [Anaerofustis]MCO8194426.1 hypothetical protein [Anaerofustis sp. NSJ-163]